MRAVREAAAHDLLACRLALCELVHKLLPPRQFARLFHYRRKKPEGAAAPKRTDTDVTHFSYLRTKLRSRHCKRPVSWFT